MTEIRNIAIIAHVDHGKTTLVDRILHQVKLFRENQQPGELILDSNDLERERGITILAKNVSIRYKGVKINVIDTPGHADFGGEVERVLNMADGVLLVVDAFEGPMPQTRFVLEKALQLDLKPILVINKVDKPHCDPELVQEQVFDLMFSLGASNDQLDFPTVFGSAKQGWMSDDWRKPTTDVSILLDTIIQYIPTPRVEEGPLQMMITSLDYSSYIGRIAVGRVSRGIIQAGNEIAVIRRDGSILRSKVKELYTFEGLGKERIKTPVQAGEIVALLGPEEFDIGDTIADVNHPEPMPPIKIDEPTMNMLFTINNSPFYGKEGKYVTSRHIYERLMLETQKNLALRVEETSSPDSWLVYGRGVLHISILIETMRREGYEFQVGQPRVILKEINGQKCEPVENLAINVPEEFSGKVIDLVTQRKGEIEGIHSRNGRTYLEFNIPARGLIGLRNQLLTATEGEAIIAHRFKDYEPWKGDIPSRKNGVLIAMETGEAIAYSIDRLQDRGTFFIEPGQPVYAGQILGEHIRNEDLLVNVILTKKLSNVRAAGSDEKMMISPPRRFSLEEALEYIESDEYVEVTPENIRMRKIILDHNERKRSERVG